MSRDRATLYLARVDDDELFVVDTTSLGLVRTFAPGGLVEDVAVPP